MALTEEQREDLKAKYGDEVAVVDKPQGVFVFKKPPPISFERYVEAISNPKKGSTRTSAFMQLCRECLVHPTTDLGKPDLAKLAQLFEVYPGIAMAVGGELSDLAGAGESHVGKL